MRRLARFREPPAAMRLARALWIAWAIIVWNVVFDRMIVVAGRDYINAADRAVAESARTGHPAFAKMDDWMRPAVTRGLWIASAAGGAILLTGLISIHLAAVHMSTRTAAPPFRCSPIP